MEAKPELILPFEIIAQSTALNIDFQKLSVESVTQLRVKINDLSCRDIHLNLLQPEIKRFRLHTPQMYQKEKNKITDKGLDSAVEFFCEMATPTQIMAHFDRVYNEKIPKNVFHFESQTALLDKLYSDGEVVVHWGLGTDEKKTEKMARAYDAGYRLFFTLEFETAVVGPTGPSFFQVYNDSVYFIKDSSFGSARSLFVCQDAIDNCYMFETLKVTVNDVKKMVLCSGELERVQQSKTERSFEYKICKKLNPSFVGIVAGEFYEFPGKGFVKQFFSTEPEIHQNDCEEILSTLARFETSVLGPDNSDTFMVLLPGVFPNDLNDNPLFRQPVPVPQFFYHGFFLVNQELFLQPKYLELNPFIVSTFLKGKFLSKVASSTQFVSEEHLWILIGSLSLIDDAAVFLINGQDSYSIQTGYRRSLYHSLVERGLDRHTLSSPRFFSPNQAFQETTYILKCGLTFLPIAAFLKLNKQNHPSYFSTFGNDKPLTYREFKRALSTKFAFKYKEALKEIVATYIDFTGTVQLELSYRVLKKESKMEIEVLQKPTSLAYFMDSNNRRFDIENYHALESRSQKLVLDLRRKFDDLIAQAGIKKKEELAEEKQSIVLANAQRNALRRARVRYQVNLIEIYKQQNKFERIHPIVLEGAESRHTLPLNTQFKRNYNKKPSQSRGDDKGSVQAGVPGEKAESAQEQSQAGGVDRDKLSHSEEEAEKVTFKIAPDPQRYFLFDTIVRDTRANILEHIGQSVDQRGALADQMDLLNSLVRQSDRRLPSELLSLLKQKTTGQYLKICILRTLRAKSDLHSEFRAIDLIDGLMSMVKGAKFEEDGTVKPTRSENEAELMCFLEMIKTLVWFDRRQREGALVGNQNREENIIEMVLELVVKNENSINSDDSDSYYQACLLKVLLKCSKSLYFDRICQEILRYLKTETYNNPKLKFAVATIFRYFGLFIRVNMAFFHYSTAPEQGLKFAQLPIFQENEHLRPVIQHFEALRKKLRGNPLVAPAIFAHKLFIKLEFSQFRLVNLIVYGLRYVNREGARFGPLTKWALLKELVQFMTKHKQRLNGLQKELSTANVESLSELIWAQLNCGSSVVDPRLRTLYLQIYYLVFDEYIPISDVDRDRNSLFPLDSYWLQFPERLSWQKHFTKEPKIVSFRFISLLKKNKHNRVVEEPRGKAYNIRELITQSAKGSFKGLESRDVMKNIINVLLNETNISNIENVVIPEELNQRGSVNFGFTMQIKRVPSIKRLKDSLDSYHSLEALRQSLLEVLTTFRNKGYFSDEVFEEERSFVDSLISEGKSLLREQLERKKASREAFKITVPGAKRVK